MKCFLRNCRSGLIKLALCVIILFINVGFVSAATTNWTGGTSSDWSNSANWSNGVPVTGSTAQIGVTVGFNNQPVINSSVSGITSLVFGVNGLIVLGSTTNVITLTVNSGFTLAVSGSITQNSSSSLLSALSTSTFTTTLAGAGTVTCGSLTVGNNNVFLTVSLLTTNYLIFVSTISNFSITGNVVVNATTQGTSLIPLIVAIGFNDAAFSLQGGITTVGGTIQTVNTTQGLILTGNSTPTFSIDMPTGSALTPVLQLTNANAINSSSVAGSMNFYNNTGGTGTCTVSYNGTGSQEVYTSTSTILSSSPQTYQYLLLTTSGAKTTDAGTLSVAANLTTSATAATPLTTVLFNSHNTVVTVGGNWTNSCSTTQGTGNITVTGSVTNNSGGTLNLGTSNFLIATNYTNNLGGVYTQSTGTTFFNGTGAQTLVDNSTAGTTFNNVTFNGTSTSTINAGTGNFAVSTTGVLTMANSATLVAGTATAGGAAYLTLLSNATSTAAVAIIPSTCSITGNVNAQRYITGTNSSYSSYRLLSSPVNTISPTSGSGNYISLYNLNKSITAGG